MTDLELHQPHRDPLPDKVAYAKALAEADLLPAAYRRKPGNVLLAVEYGELLGVHPLTAIQQVHVIDGKLSMSSELMRAMVSRAGHRFRVIESTDQGATVSIVRADDPTHETKFSFTMADADNAGLSKRGTSWKNYPAAMCLARATSAAVRAVCPDVLMGISYTPDELGAVVNADGEVIDVTVIESDPDPIATIPARLGLTEPPELPDGWVTVADAKRQVLDACDGDKDRAAGWWADIFGVDRHDPLEENEVDELVESIKAEVIDAELVE